MKSVRIWSFFGPYSARMWENTNQKTPNTDTFKVVFATTLRKTENKMQGTYKLPNIHDKKEIK